MELRVLFLLKVLNQALCTFEKLLESALLYPQQQWIWHTGEDVIVAVKSEHRPFVLSYRPSLLDPSFL